ncbi:putative bifunctional diguanylate cyclase/phosphodiesterase [Chitinibacter sp. S2-10]|uniref:putative bifunctional diguanylate cyclase/phosphodiesterase n=1 Tax=Chitinibacter sp. S2-10 TaxID=3373597 RepID=UPI0039775E54
MPQDNTVPPSPAGASSETVHRTRRMNIRHTDRLLTKAEMLLSNRGQNESSQQDTLAVIADLIHAATHDVLTGLPTRGVLLSRLESELTQAGSADERVAVLFVDLDNFKLVNDSLGHDSGDELLCEVAKRISDCVDDGESGIVSRIGGDEFIILFPHAIRGSEDVLASKILAAVTEPVKIAAREIVTSASIGVASCALGSQSAEQLLRDADTALYAAKARGRNCMVRFNHELHARAVRRMQIESDLRVALLEKQVYVHYQPQVSLVTGQLVGVEALARWQHPEYGMVSPAEFIPIAEDSRLIGELGRQVLRSACLQLAAWSAALPERPLSMTVNVSPRQLGDPDFIAEVQAIVEQTGIRLSSLCLELTESALTNSATEVLKTLNQLHQMGIYVAIDDFGTEYSSLARLRDLPIEVLKIDRSFIDGLGTEPGDTAIVSSILSLAFATGKHVIAEGIERVEQALALRSMGCGVAQGFLFSAPVDATFIMPMLDKPLWEAPMNWGVQAAAVAPDTLTRRAHRTFIEEFLDHIGVPMGLKAGDTP